MKTKQLSLLFYKLGMAVCITSSAYAAVNVPASSRSLPPFYARADLIYSIPAKVFFTGPYNGGDEKKFKSSFGGAGGFGFAFNEKFRTDLTAIYRGTYKHSYFSSGTRTTQKADSLAFMLTGYFIPKICHDGKLSNLRPYLVGAAGISVNRSGNRYFTSQQTQSGVFFGNTAKAFAWQIGLGTTYQINREYNLDLAYKYTNLGTIKTSSFRQTPSGNIVATSPMKGQLKAHEISIGIIKFFNITR
jgi:opacity protein-like surface antigen